MLKKYTIEILLLIIMSGCATQIPVPVTPPKLPIPANVHQSCPDQLPDMSDDDQSYSEYIIKISGIYYQCWKYEKDDNDFIDLLEK